MSSLCAPSTDMSSLRPSDPEVPFIFLCGLRFWEFGDLDIRAGLFIIVRFDFSDLPANFVAPVMGELFSAFYDFVIRCLVSAYPHQKFRVRVISSVPSQSRASFARGGFCAPLSCVCSVFF